MNKQDKPVSNHIWRVDDTARVVDNSTSHLFEIGEIVRLLERRVEEWRAEYLDGHDYWYVKERDIEPLEQVKPRICEVLGVEVGELFCVVDREAGYDSADLTVNEAGDVVSLDLAAKLPPAILVVHAVNHPESIIRPPRFPAAELEAMRLLYAAGAETIARADDGLLSWHGGLTQGLLPHKLFPSLRAGQTVVLGEIVGG